MLIYVQIMLVLTIGAISAITDFKDKKIYNKNLIIAFFISFITYIILYKQIETYYIKKFFINLAISTLISFLFFYFKIWAAGDAKLFILIIFMIPIEIYDVNENNFFPGLYLLMIIFSIAFIYIFVETIVLFIKDNNKKEKFKLHQITKEKVLQFLITYFMGYFIILFINNFLGILIPKFYMTNQELIYISNFLILFYLYRIINSNKVRVVILLITCLSNIVYYWIYGVQNYRLDFKVISIVFIIILYRTISNKYNYKEINIKDLKDRMILSFGSVLNFYGSKVKGLPLKTDETTDSRLTKEEVESIKKWSKTKKGKETITIVKHMPFAPFMFVGEVIFLIIKVFISGGFECGK